MNNKLTLGLCAAALVLTACAPATPSAASIGTAIAQTQAALPTATTIPSATPAPTATQAPSATPIPTATKIPLSAVDLVPLLSQPGDLPAGVTTGQVIRNGDANTLPNAPKPEQTVFLGFGANGQDAGGIVVWLFSSTADAQSGYKNVSNRIDTQLGSIVTGTWETGFAEPPDIFDENFLVSQGLAKAGQPVLGGLVFKECQAVAYIQIAYDRQYLDPIVSYANNVAERIKPIVCN